MAVGPSITHPHTVISELSIIVQPWGRQSSQPAVTGPLLSRGGCGTVLSVLLYKTINSDLIATYERGRVVMIQCFRS